MLKKKVPFFDKFPHIAIKNLECVELFRILAA